MTAHTAPRSFSSPSLVDVRCAATDPQSRHSPPVQLPLSFRTSHLDACDHSECCKFTPGYCYDMSNKLMMLTATASSRCSPFQLRSAPHIPYERTPAAHPHESARQGGVRETVVGVAQRRPGDPSNQVLARYVAGENASLTLAPI